MNTQEIMDIDKKYYMNVFGDRIPVVFDHGHKCTLVDKEGNSYTDFLAGIAVNVLGHNHKILVDAVKSQAEKLIHCTNLYYIESQAQLEELLVDNCCGDRVFFSNSGAEANEGAIKLARKYFWNKKMNKYEVITTDNSFHGRTLSTLAATGQKKYQEAFEPMPDGFINVPYNDISAVRNAINDKTCAVMIELIQGEGGIILSDKLYVEELRKLCDEKDILLIFDEVQTGIGRTGKLFAYEHYNIEPDIITLAKALGGGIPIGAFIAKESVAKAFCPGDHGSTFGGSPLACAAGYAVLKTLINEGLIQKSQDLGAYFKKKLTNLMSKYDFINEVRGIGLMLGMELSNNINGKEIVSKCFEKGFLINCAGKNTLRFVPPLIISTDEIDSLMITLEDIFNEYKTKEA